MKRAKLTIQVSVRPVVCACMRACVRACVRACMRVHVCMHVCLLYMISADCCNSAALVNFSDIFLGLTY